MTLALILGFYLILSLTCFAVLWACLCIGREGS